MAMIGFLSDSHGEWLRTRKAIQLLREHQCDTIIHLGDVETHGVLDELADNNVTLVFGNCDYVTQLVEYAVTIGIDVQDPAGTMEIDGITIAFLHGHDFNQYQTFLDDDNINIIAHGHSHEIRDEMVENTRCINPGALHRAPRYTVAVLNTKTKVLDFLEVEP
jgi:putative phosphoesterase